MEDISNITKQTLFNLSKRGVDATPIEYEKEFCKIAQEIEFSIEECEYFKYAISKLSENELKEKNNKIETTKDLIDILLQRVEKKNLDKMSELFQESLRPSISLKIDNELKKFSIKIGDAPSLMFEEDIQKEMEKFIENRFEVDKKIVAKKTADIARLITLMSKYLGDAIHSNTKGSNSVSDIRDQINSLEMSATTKEELNKLQTKLVKAALSIENEMNEVNKNLQSGKNEVTKLESRIKELEDELKKTKQLNTKDHLTGVLNRRAYEEKINNLDEMYKRLGQDFAVVFFDLDHFKNINDSYGHEGGDIVLKTFASLLQKLTRDIDIVGRYGGEEFVVALHYNNISELEKYVTRIKSVVTNNKFVLKNDIRVKITFSAGIELRSNKKDLNETVSSADSLLYKAKNTGRDKVIFWDGKEL